MTEAVNRARGLRELQSRLGYNFADKTYLKRALTHRSAGADHNERLEFLGDGALNFVIAASLFEICDDAPEGDLSRLRAALVNEATLATIAGEIDVAEELVLGPGEVGDGSRRRDSIRADTLEAILGAIYRDGGFVSVERVVHGLYAKRLANLPNAADTKDAKTQLQEWLQARGRARPEYELVRSTGSDHCREFVARCQLTDSEVAAEGADSSRRKAEQAAARRILDRLMRAAGQ